MLTVSIPDRDPHDAEVEHISVSQAGLVETCPLQWRFKYIDKLPTPEREDSDNFLLGNAIDRALSEWERSHSHPAASAHIEALPERLRAKGWAALGDWALSGLAFNPERHVQRRHIHTIHPRHSYGEGLAVIGYSDLISGRTLIDWKYGGKPNDAAWVRRIARQLRFYAYAETELPIDRTAYIVRFGGKELVTIPIDLYDAEGVQEMVDWLYDCAHNGPGATEHSPTPGAHCGWCPYTKQCAEQCASWARRVGNVY